MNKKILLAVDHSQPSKMALEYAIQMSNLISDLHYVLYHVQPMVSLFLKDEARTNIVAKEQLKKISNKNEGFARSLLDEYRSTMMDRSIASDHISFIMSGDSETDVTLLHVASNARNTCEIDVDEQPDAELEEIILRGDKACIDQFYTRVMEKINQAGIDEKRVRFETIESRRRIGKAIMDFAEKGDYRTLVVGRRGIDKSFFMGSVSRYMINNLSDGGLWVIP